MGEGVLDSKNMSVSFRGWLEGPHKVDRYLLERVSLINRHEGVSLCLGVAIPGLANLAPMNEVLYHLMQSREMEISPNAG